MDLMYTRPTEEFGTRSLMSVLIASTMTVSPPPLVGGAAAHEKQGRNQ